MVRYRPKRGYYVYCVKVGGIVRYIGKGKANRRHFHFKHARRISERRQNGERVSAVPFYNKLAKAYESGVSIESEIIRGALTEKCAYELEAEIEGIYPKGQLWNFVPCGGGAQQLWNNPKTRKKILQRIREATGSPENRARASEHAKQLWADPKTRKKILHNHRLATSSPDFSEKQRKAMANKMTDPAYREALSAGHKRRYTKKSERLKTAKTTKASWADPAIRAKRIAGQKLKFATEENKIKRSATTKANWASGIYKNAIKASHTPEASAKRKASGKALWADPVWRSKMMEARRSSRLHTQP